MECHLIASLLENTCDFFLFAIPITFPTNYPHPVHISLVFHDGTIIIQSHVLFVITKSPSDDEVAAALKKFNVHKKDGYYEEDCENLSYRCIVLWVDCYACEEVLYC